MSDFIVKPLDENTWPDFARLVEKHNDGWGGCWCLAMFENQGFQRTRQLGKTHWIVTRVIDNRS